MDMLRGFAVLAIVVHHWLLFDPFQGSILVFSSLAGIIRDVAGTMVHLFFILSGCGLTLSYFKRRQSSSFSWIKWGNRRISKIVAPYWILVSFAFLLAGVSYFVFSGVFEHRYGLATLLAYLTFTGNFYAPGWSFNPTLWFMPVIIGLYVLFPFLVKVLEGCGTVFFVVVSLLITYGSISLCLLLRYPVAHQSALPLFYVIEFSAGMLIGDAILFHSQRFEHLASAKFLILGMALYVLSWGMTKYWTYGDAYNDLITAAGVFLITLYVSMWLIRLSPHKSVRLFTEISRESYVMYLIHGPIILYVMRPILRECSLLPLHPGAAIFCSFLYAAFIFVLARLISRPIGGISSRLMAMTLPITVRQD